jgi:hypothetical protein
VREHREHAGAAELALIDGNGAVEIHDWLPLARPAGCLSRRTSVAVATMIAYLCRGPVSSAGSGGCGG